jgi:hypothetical protein
MKIFCILFSAYIFLLAGMPCGDAPGCDASQTIGMTQEHSSHDHESESCSPFCICACCGTSSQVAAAQHLELKPSVISSSPSSYLTEHISEVSISIWQPPKLG